MPELSPDQVRLLLVASQEAEDTSAVAQAAQEVLDQTLLQVAKDAKVGLRELAAVTGLHPNSIRAGIQRAAGPSTIDFEQPELDLTSLMSAPDLARASFPHPAAAVVAAGRPSSTEASAKQRLSGGREEPGQLR